MRLNFIAALLVACSVQAAVPTPESHFGHEIGADRELLDWDKVVSYFRALEQASDKIRVEELGKTVEGRPFIAATIADPETLRDLDRYREIQRRLADPRDHARGRSGETDRAGQDGGADHLLDSLDRSRVHAHRGRVRLPPAHRGHAALPRHPARHDSAAGAVAQSRRRGHRDALVPRTLGTAYEGTSPPELYHKYVGHDNNRDWYMFTQPETRLTVAKLHNVWHPQIVYDVHQQEPYMRRACSCRRGSIRSSRTSTRFWRRK